MTFEDPKSAIVFKRYFRAVNSIGKQIDELKRYVLKLEGAELEESSGKLFHLVTLRNASWGYLDIMNGKDPLENSLMTK